MPSVDQCLNKPLEMTTLTNSLEVFDTYKHKEDKDSDEESFHLPLDDDESDPKYQDTVVKNGNGNESEDEILNKFETGPASLEPIDSRLEKSLLDEEEKSNGIKENGTDDNSKTQHEDVAADKSEATTVNTEILSENKINKTTNGIINDKSNAESSTQDNSDEVQKDNVPNVDVDTIITKEANSTDVAPSENTDQEKCDAELDKLKNDETSSKPSNKNESKLNDDPKSESELKTTSSNEDDRHDKSDKCEISNDSPKSPNEDSEELFDISIIRDAAEDNAESAYNEAHPEDSHMEENEEEEECHSDRANNLDDEEEEEDTDLDKHEDPLKNDDVDIEETKLDCDGESDSGNKTELVQINKKQVQNACGTVNSEKDSTVTGTLVDDDSAQTKSPVGTDDGAQEISIEAGKDSDKRKSLKRNLSEEGETSNVAKKSKTEQNTDPTSSEDEKPKKKPPLKILLSLTEFLKSKDPNVKLTMQDLEQFCVHKACEVIVHKSVLGDVRHELKLQEQLIDAMRKEILQLSKQSRDLEIVNKKLMNDLKQQNATQKPLNPLKITRSVGLQVKFTPAFDANMKRRQQQNPALAASKTQGQTTPNRASRNIPNTVSPVQTRQATSTQKQQQQQISKPTTPLLSQALQTRRAASNDNNASKSTTSQAIRPKVPDTKSTGSNPSASVIDLTDEDDKKDKNKNAASKMAQKSITVPLRTTPMRVNTTQGIRLATPQGKVSPFTSVVTSSAPQLMYVVQSSPQNSSIGATKAVVVNFQSTNGVLPSTLNGSAVSVIPKQSNTIQLKMTPQKTLPTNKVIKPLNKHPAPLPPPPLVRVNSEKPLKPIPPKPHLTIRKTDTGIILQWKMPYELEMYEVIASYQLYAYQETSATPSTDMWRKVGDVKALALPMACTLTQFADKNKYYFAVRPVDIHKRIGVFSEPEEISL